MKTKDKIEPTLFLLLLPFLGSFSPFYSQPHWVAQDTGNEPVNYYLLLLLPHTFPCCGTFPHSVGPFQWPQSFRINLLHTKVILSPLYWHENPTQPGCSTDFHFIERSTQYLYKDITGDSIKNLSPRAGEQLPLLSYHLLRLFPHCRNLSD